MSFSGTDTRPVGFPWIEEQSHWPPAATIRRLSQAKILYGSCQAKPVLGTTIPDFEFQPVYSFTSIPRAQKQSNIYVAWQSCDRGPWP